ncbi:hypothetical protein F5X68DRAFT_238465 [Plectosphaerella plurivora]|uniref:Carrier domain-containing protein n=1 Tax=Plectosphaerella plurivora TaxID=936078 RepID=A0A9P8VLL5_9PEZI|nr:hypothetical protein F5X68DRAFT_238465 [Plectosphaerella plurivora]
MFTPCLTRPALSAPVDAQIIPRKNTASGGIYDLERNITVLQLEGLRFDVLSSVGDPTTEHVYAHLGREIDPFLSSEVGLGHVLEKKTDAGIVQKLLGLIHRHSPALKVLEISLDPQHIGALGSHVDIIKCDITTLTTYAVLSTRPATQWPASSNVPWFFMTSPSPLERGLNLGADNGTGIIDDNDDIRDRLASTPDLLLVNEPLLSKMVQFPIMQQRVGAPPQPPQPRSHADPRMRGLVASQDGAAAGRKGSDEAAELKVLLRSGTRDSPVADLMISVASAWLFKTLRLHDAVEPERPLTIYGLDSLATVEFRNWVKSEFGAVLSVVDITKATSLAHLAEAILARAETAASREMRIERARC